MTGAILMKKTDIALFLIKNGADVNAVNKNGTTPLFFSKSTDLTDLLLKKGAAKTINQRGYADRTALHEAVEQATLKK